MFFSFRVYWSILELKFKTHGVNITILALLNICVDLIYVKMYKRTDFGNFEKYILLGHKGCHRRQTVPERTAIEISELFHVTAFL